MSARRQLRLMALAAFLVAVWVARATGETAAPAVRDVFELLPAGSVAIDGEVGARIRLGLENRVKAHLFLCMLAYSVERHLRQAWEGLLFHDEEGGERSSPVAPLEPSESAKQKKRSPRANADLPLQSYRGLIQSLSALTRATIRLGSATFTRCAQPTALQAEAFKCLGLTPP